MLDFAECERLVSTARDKRSKPVQNNTRVEKRNEDTYALRLHATDIATFHRDGRITVTTGGWRTVTTAERLDSYVFDRGRQRYSDRGVWYVKATPDANDPEPARGDRSVLKPFHALDPGPEPIDDGVGCIADTVRAEAYEEETLVSNDELDGPRGWTREHIVRTYEGGSGYFAGYVLKRGIDVTYFSAEPYQHQVPNWHGRIDEEFGSLSINDRSHFKQCPHCKLFAERHRAWSEAMNGGGWGRNRTHGYAKMVELLDLYGSREAWQEAYITDYREARQQRRIHKEWVERNRVQFEDGMEIDSNGYAPRPDPKAIAREQRKLKRIQKKKDRVRKFVGEAIVALKKGVPMPSGGDCWGCAFRTEDKTVEPMGVDHLEQHIKERYYVPSMFVNALRVAGYRDEGIAMFLAMDFEHSTMGGERIDEETVRRALAKYLSKRLIPEVAS